MSKPTSAHSGRASALVVPLVVALVVAVGLGTRGGDEVYPFAQWAMFSRVPATMDLWTLRIHELDGHVLDGAPMLRQVPVLARNFEDSGAHRQIDAYGRTLRAIANGHDRDPEELARYRRRVERRLRGHQVTYQVVNVRGSPLDLLDGEEPVREVDAGTFEVP